MIIDEFEVLSTTDSVICIIHSYRARKYQMQRGSLMSNWMAPIESGYEYRLIDFLADSNTGGPLQIWLGSTETGTKIKFEVEQLSPKVAEYTNGLIEEIKRKTKRRVRRIAELADREPFNKLTEREIEVADLLADGKTHQEIAEILVIGKETIGSHSDHIAQKLDIRGNRANALLNLRNLTG